MALDMSVRHRCLAALLLLAMNASASGVGAGLGEALQRIGDAGLRNSPSEEALKREQETTDRQHQQRMQQLRLELEVERRRASPAPVVDAEALRTQVDLRHPGWRDTVQTEAFKVWMASQPASVRRLADSRRVEDASLLLDLYKRDASR